MLYWIKSLFVNDKKREEKYYAQYFEQFNSFLSQHNAKLISYEYFHKYFGSMRLEFEHNGKVHICEYEKGQIFLDNKLLDGGVCYFSGENDRMMEIIETLVFKKENSNSE